MPAWHPLRSIDRFFEVDGLRQELAPFHSEIDRPSMMIRMLIVGYCSGIRSEWRLREEVHLNLAYRWFCRLGLEGRCLITRRSRRTGMGAFPCPQARWALPV